MSQYLTIDFFLFFIDYFYVTHFTVYNTIFCQGYGELFTVLLDQTFSTL